MEGYPFRENIIINQCISYDFLFMGNSILMMKVLFNLIKNAEEQIIAKGKGDITIITKEFERGSFQEGTKFPSTPLQPFASLGYSQ